MGMGICREGFLQLYYYWHVCTTKKYRPIARVEAGMMNIESPYSQDLQLIVILLELICRFYLRILKKLNQNLFVKEQIKLFLYNNI